MAIEQPQRLQHDHALVEARWRFGVIARCQGRAAKLQSVIADSALVSIPEEDDACPAPARPKRDPGAQSSADFKTAMEEGLQGECESARCDDALAHVFEEAARNTSRRGSEAAGSFWSTTEDASYAERPCPTAPPHATTPGPKAASAEPRRPRSVAFLRVMLHTSLPGAPGMKGLTAVASIECPEDRAWPRLRFRQGATTLAVLVLDGKSIRVSLVADPCSDARGGDCGDGPSCATQWLKLTCEGGGNRRGDLYAYAALGWRALLPHLYA